MPRLSQELLDLCGLSLISEGRKKKKHGKQRPPIPLRYEFVEGVHADGTKKKSRNANRNRNKKTSIVKEEEIVTKESKISWGQVELFYFERAVGYGTVPSRGAYPLGLGAEEEAMRESSSIDCHQNSVAAHLLVRAHQLGVTIPPAPPDDGEKESTWCTSLETRQLDYKKSGNINPLFNPLSEEDRIVILGHTLRGNKSRSGSIVDSETRVDSGRSGAIRPMLLP